jgi:hypothetical protein
VLARDDSGRSKSVVVIRHVLYRQTRCWYGCRYRQNKVRLYSGSIKLAFRQLNDDGAKRV